MQTIFRVSLLLVLLFSVSVSNAANYYFSSATGDDSRSAAEATNADTPWRSLAKLNSNFGSLKPGDSVLFKRGEVFEGSIVVTASGSTTAPIVLAAYGTGEKPVITGFTHLRNWTPAGSNIWEAVISTTANELNIVLVNGRMQPVGRFPNSGAANGGYLPVESFSGNSSITDSKLYSSPNWVGGEVVIRKNRWVLDKNLITSHNGSTISYTSESGYHATAGYGYFIQNHPGTLDQHGEWYFQNKKLGLYLSAGSPEVLVVKGSTEPVLVTLANQSHVVFSGISFTGANQHAFRLNNAGDVTVLNCNVQYSGVNAFHAADLNGLRIENTTVSYTNNNALNIENCMASVVKNNIITNTGTIPGMGKGNSGSYEAILLSGNNNLVEGNTIDSTGYTPVTFSGSSIVIKNNLIRHFSLVKDDGGGIYTWNNGPNAQAQTDRKITGNIIVAGRSAGWGTPDKSPRFAHGIYLDDNTTGVDVSGNTVANCEGFGLYIHNARENRITNNTIYNNTVQLEMVHDDIAPASPIRNTDVSSNVFFSLQPSQLVAEFKSRADDVREFGNFDGNYYSRPFSEDAVIGVLKNVSGTYYYQQVDLAGWKALYGKDPASNGSPKTFLPYRITSTVSGNKFSNGSFTDNTGGLYAFSPANNCQTSWASNELDGGSLAVRFSSITNNSKGTVVIGVGALTKDRSYLIRFSVKGSDENKMLDVYLRKSGAPYNDVAARRLVKVLAKRKEVEILFTATESTPDGSIGIDVPEQVSPLYFDNIDVKEVTAVSANVTDSVKFVYNPSPVTATTTLGANYTDVRGSVYHDAISLAPYHAAVLLANGGAGVDTTPGFCTAVGSISRELWVGVDGNDLAQAPFSTAPSSEDQLTIFESQRDAADQYAARIRGYLCAPQTGNYTFWIAGDDATELWLSTSDDPTVKVKIAYNQSWTDYREWNRFASQQSVTVFLEAGRKYYIEALHKEGAGGDHLSVAWQLPDGSREAPIAGNRLSPFGQTVAPSLANQTILFSALENFMLGGEPLVLKSTASSGLPVSFTIQSGPATLNGNSLVPTGAGSVVIKASQAGNESYHPAPDVLQQLTILPAVQTACDATGSILREQWNNVRAKGISSIPLSTPPSSTSQLNKFEGPVDIANYYGARIRGYICPPQTGNYTFWIAGDDATELWLSTSENAADKRRIAYRYVWTKLQEWNKAASQKSAPVFLEAGRKYYIEALHKEITGGDHVSVAWQMPDGVLEAPIAGSRLSPFVPVVTDRVGQTINFSALSSVTFGDSPVTLTATASSGLPVSFSILSGPAILTGNSVKFTGVGTIHIKATQQGGDAFFAAPDVVQTLEVLPLVVCTAVGTISRELWVGVDGNDLAQAPFSTAPSSEDQLTIFESQRDAADQYAARIRGYLCAPQTGNYTFWIAGDDATELWLSTSDDPTVKVKIAYNQSWTDYREWNRFASQQSVTVFLEAGRKYYIEALHKEGAGGDHLSVAWQLPDGSREAPIAGNRLSPFGTDVAILSATQTSADKQGGKSATGMVGTNEAAKVVVTVYPNPFSQHAFVNILPAQSAQATIDLYDLSGRKVSTMFSGKLLQGTLQRLRLEASPLAAGVYFIRLTSAGRVVNYKVIKSK